MCVCVYTCLYMQETKKNVMSRLKYPSGKSTFKKNVCFSYALVRSVFDHRFVDLFISQLGICLICRDVHLMYTICVSISVGISLVKCLQPTLKILLY